MQSGNNKNGKSALKTNADYTAFDNLKIPIAFIWGVAEATLFFIVPDVWLSVAASKKLDSRVYKSILYAIAGAILGGIVMYLIGRFYPNQALIILENIPGIHADLLQIVKRQVEEYGLLAVLLGPIKGIPYKIYAVNWGIHNGNLLLMCLISIPARGIRFFVTAVLARGIWILFDKLFGFWNKIGIVLILLFWVSFYIFYFNHFGW